jgi:hypothetical protein
MNYLTDPELVDESGNIRHGVYVWSDYDDEYTFMCWTLDVWAANRIAEALKSMEADFLEMIEDA